MSTHATKGTTAWKTYFVVRVSKKADNVDHGPPSLAVREVSTRRQGKLANVLEHTARRLHETTL